MTECSWYVDVEPSVRKKELQLLYIWCQNSVVGYDYVVHQPSRFSHIRFVWNCLPACSLDNGKGVSLKGDAGSKLEGGKVGLYNPDSARVSLSLSLSLQGQTYTYPKAHTKVHTGRIIIRFNVLGTTSLHISHFHRHSLFS